MKKDSKKKIIIGLIIVIFIFMLIIVAMLIPKMFGRLKGDILSVTTSDLPNIDSNFYNCIRESYRNDTGNNISSSYVLSSSELANINAVSCTNVSNTAALKYMTGLTELRILNSLSLNEIDLSNNLNLVTIVLSDLNLRSLDVSKNAKAVDLQIFNILRDRIEIPVGETYTPIKLAPKYSNNGYDIYYEISQEGGRGDIGIEHTGQTGICDVNNPYANPSYKATIANGWESFSLVSNYCNNPGGILETSNWKYMEAITVVAVESSIPDSISVVNNTFAKIEAGITAGSLININATIVITRGNQQISGNDILSTGDSITINGQTYEIVISGDLNNNGIVTISDVTKAYAFVKNKTTLTDAQRIAADYNGNNIITVSDVSALYSMSKSN